MARGQTDFDVERRRAKKLPNKPSKFKYEFAGPPAGTRLAPPPGEPDYNEIALGHGGRCTLGRPAHLQGTLRLRP